MVVGGKQMPTKKPPHDKNASAGRYSGSDQQDVPDYGHAGHKQGRAGKAHPEQARRPWQGRPQDREGQYGYRRDQGAHGRKVDGESATSEAKGEGRYSGSQRQDTDRWADVRPVWKGWKG
jgi:hypothetical protein